MQDIARMGAEDGLALRQEPGAVACSSYDTIGTPRSLNLNVVFQMAIKLYFSMYTQIKHDLLISLLA